MSLEAHPWLNAELVQKILQRSESDHSINVKSLTTKQATETGDNYMSEMLRVNIEYSRNKSNQIVEEKTSLLFKIAPEFKDGNYGLMLEYGTFNVEKQMLINTLVKMNDVLNENDYRLSPRLLYAEAKDRIFFVIEDLAPLGYQMADRRAGLDLQHFLIAMKGLAKFHASSVAVCEKEPEQKLLYPGGLYHKDSPESCRQFVTGGMKILANEVAMWPELGARAKDYSKKLFKIAEVSFKKGQECTESKDDEFNVINHGDFLVNNMLFRYDKESNVVGHIFVDFQVSVWASPAIDILYFFNTSTSNDAYFHHRDILIKEYLNVLTNTMLRLKCSTKPPTMQELQKTLKDREIFEVLTSSIIMPFALINKNETMKINEIINGSGYNNPAYKKEAYRKIMAARIEQWDAQGLLDV